MKIFRCSLAIFVAVLVMAAILGACAPSPAPPTPPAPTPERNQAPVISSITANPTQLTYGDSSTIVCVCTDPDDDPININWSASDGSVTGTGGQVTWVAPSKDGNFNVSVTVSDNRGAKTTGSVTIAVSTPIKTVTINPVAAETGTVNQRNATDYSKTKAGDDAQNIGYRAFWGFDISSVAYKNIQSATLKFTTGTIVGKPFHHLPPEYLGGLKLWKATYGSTLPQFGYVGAEIINTGAVFEPPTSVDVTTEIRVLSAYGVNRLQVEALFGHVSNGNNSPDYIEWSSVVLEIIYSVK